MRMTIAAIEIDSFIENTMSIGDRLELGHQQNRSIIYRAFPKASPTANLAAGSREFSTQNSYLTGNCFTFNGPETSNESVIAEGIGQEYGLFMVLDAESDEYTTYGDFTRPQVRGFRLDVHTHNTISEVNTAPIMVSTGSEVHINIKQSVIERLEAPYGECDREYERSYEEIYGYQYNLLNCREACLPYQVLAVCGCYHSAYTKYYSKKHLTTHRKCDFRLEEGVSTVTDYPCVHDVRRRLTTDLKCTCPLACRETRYAVDMSSLPIQQTMFPLYKYMVCFKHSESECSKLENIPEDQQLEVIRRNVAYVHIYYLDLVYDHYIQKKAYDRSQFISDFGGNLGLWLGASIVTILEFIELLTKLGAISMFKSNCKCSKKTRDNVCASPRKGKRKSRKNNKQALPLQDVSNA